MGQGAEGDASRHGDKPFVDSYEDVSMFALADQSEQTLLDTQTECCFMWSTSAGDPVGVIMNFVHHDGRFWLTCTRRRKRVPAIEARPRVAVAISSRGTDIGISQAVTYKGTAIVRDDDAIKSWMYRALAERVRPGDTTKQDAFVAHLESPGRVVIEIVPDVRIGFDSQAMFANSPAGSSTTRVTTAEQRADQKPGTAAT
jgi:general stress protein 26